jgi:predicted MFS family arabinose efflux permease
VSEGPAPESEGPARTPETIWQKRTGLIGVMTANGIAVLGSRMSFIAIPWLVLTTTGSPTLMGVVAAAETLPFVLASSLGAPLADRFGIRRTAITADLSSVLVMIAIAAFHSISIPLLIAMVAVAGTLRGFGDNSKKVLIPPLAARAEAPMVRVTSIFDGMSRLSFMVGAAIAGILVATVGISVTLLVNAAMFGVAALLVITLGRPPADRADRAAPTREPYFQALRGGFRHVLGDRITFGILSMLFAINLFNQASGVVFIPLWAADVMQSASAVGFILSALGLGAVVGNVVFTIIATRLPRYAAFTLGFLLGGPPRFLILGISDDLWVVLVVTFLAGIALASVNPIIGVLLFERTPRALHARVFGLNTAFAWAGIPIGGVLGGLAAQSLGLSASLVVTSVLYLAVALVPVVGYRRWKVIGNRPEPPATEPVPAKATT